MKKMILTAIAICLPLTGAFAQQPKPPRPVMEDLTPHFSQGVPLPTMPNPGYQFIRGDYGPTIPAGWTLVNIEAVLQNGNSLTAWLLYLYNPSTHQTAGWLIDIP
jgi:hypothetical protein